jgi:hypothetical protein
MNALDQYLEKTGEHVSTLAVRLGLHPATLLRPLNGRRNPTMRIALEVQRGTRGEVTALDFVKICMAAREKFRPGEPPTGQLTALAAWAAAADGKSAPTRRNQGAPARKRKAASRRPTRKRAQSNTAKETRAAQPAS